MSVLLGGTTYPGWALTILRVAAGVVLTIAGYQKLTNLGGFSGFVTQAGLPAPELLGLLVPILELVGGLLLIVGFGTRVVAAYFIFHFVVIFFLVKLPRAGWDASRIDWMMLAAALVLALAGPGRAAVDEMLARRRGRVAV